MPIMLAVRTETRRSPVSRERPDSPSYGLVCRLGTKVELKSLSMEMLNTAHSKQQKTKVFRILEQNHLRDVRSSHEF